MRRPYFVAEQARNAHGLLGRLVAFIMALKASTAPTWRRARARTGARLSCIALLPQGVARKLRPGPEGITSLWFSSP